MKPAALYDTTQDDLLLCTAASAIANTNLFSAADLLESTGLVNASANAAQETLGLIIAVMAEKSLGRHSR